MALMLPNRVYRAALGVALLALAACGGSAPESAFRDYYGRLERTLAQNRPPLAPPPLPMPPRSGALQLPVATANINTLDFLALHGCALQVNIGRKNSSLGRLARPSQSLLLELEFLRLAPACIARLRAAGNTALAQQLAAAQQSKVAQLPQHIFNATLGGDEYRAFWRSARPAGEYPAVPDAVTLQALHAINAAVQRWLGGDYSVDGFTFELLLSEVAGGNGGALFRELHRQAHWLAAADELLHARAARGPLCGPDLRHSAADILPNVVEKYFVGNIQPGAAALQRSYHALLPPVRELEARLQAVLPAAYATWRVTRNELLDRGASAPRSHVQNVLQILSNCGATIGP